MSKKPKRPLRNDERVAMRLPGAVLKRVDVFAAEALCPRSLAMRRLLVKGLEAESINKRWETR